MLVLEPWSEYDLHRIHSVGLPQERLQLARQLHFISEFREATTNRCSHHLDDQDPRASDDLSESDSDGGMEDKGHNDASKDRPSRFKRLALNTKSVLETLQDGQLDSFR